MAVKAARVQTGTEENVAFKAVLASKVLWLARRAVLDSKGHKARSARMECKERQVLKAHKVRMVKWGFKAILHSFLDHKALTAKRGPKVFLEHKGLKAREALFSMLDSKVMMVHKARMVRRVRLDHKVWLVSKEMPEPKAQLELKEQMARRVCLVFKVRLARKARMDHRVCLEHREATEHRARADSKVYKVHKANMDFRAQLVLLEAADHKDNKVFWEKLDHRAQLARKQQEEPPGFKVHRVVLEFKEILDFKVQTQGLKVFWDHLDKMVHRVLAGRKASVVSKVTKVHKEMWAHKGYLVRKASLVYKVQLAHKDKEQGPREVMGHRE